MSGTRGEYDWRKGILQHDVSGTRGEYGWRKGILQHDVSGTREHGWEKGHSTT